MSVSSEGMNLLCPTAVVAESSSGGGEIIKTRNLYSA